MKSTMSERISKPIEMTAPVNFQFINTEHAWQKCLATLQGEPRLAIDLEANSMFAYRERVCLIQISIPEADYIIDPLPEFDLSGLGQLLANPAVEKIFHAAEYDLILVRRDYGWELNNLFDTMWAARILGHPHIGLSSLLERYFGIKLSKQYQKANWCQRPLKAAELNYAQMDTHYLPRLRDLLAHELAAAGRLAEAAEIFREQSRVRLPNNGFNPDGFWNLHGVYELPPVHQAVLKALYLFREEEARRRDLPLFKVLSDRTLMELAQTMPTNRADLELVHGMSPRQSSRYGGQLITMIEKARHTPPPHPPKRPPRPADDVLMRYDRLQRWRKEQAHERGVESDVIMSRDALWALAQNHPETIDELATLEILGPWRLAKYGEEVIHLLKPKRHKN